MIDINEEISVVEKGGPGSGHYGHAGRIGKVGGSVPATHSLSLRTGRDRLERQQAASGKANKPKTGFRPGMPGIDSDTKWVKSDAHDFVLGKNQQISSVMEPKRSYRGDETTAEDDVENGYADVEFYTSTERGIVKQDLVRDIFGKLPEDAKYDADNNIDGIDASNISQVVRQWAISSNDNTPESLSLQQAASEEFGIPLSAWQQSKMDDILGKHHPDDVRQLTVGGPYTFRTVDNLSRTQERQILRAIYNNTQEKLAQAGYKPTDSIQLFRGIRVEDSEGLSVKLPRTTMAFEGNVIESWTTHGKIAAAFTTHSTPNVLSQKVPVTNIISTCRTGFGCLTEAEFVVFNVPGTQITVTNIRR